MIESLLKARVFDLAQPIEASLPAHPGTVPFRMATVQRHGDVERPGDDRVSGCLEMINMSTHTGTHIDALSHISSGGMLHGGLSAEQVQRGGRLTQLGVETITPLIYHGVLLDIAGGQGVDRLGRAQAVTAEDMERACQSQGTVVPPGAAVLIRTGWGGRAFFRSVDYLDSPPGPDSSGAKWLVERQVRLTGSDTGPYEQANPRVPVHKLLIVDAGVYIVENLFLEDLARDKVYEFGLIIPPLPLVGASGSPIRPLALVR